VLEVAVAELDVEELHALDHVVEGGVVQQDVDDGDAAVLCGDLVESVDAGGSEFLEVGCVDVDRPPGVRAVAVGMDVDADDELPVPLRCEARQLVEVAAGDHEAVLGARGAFPVAIGRLCLGYDLEVLLALVHTHQAGRGHRQLADVQFPAPEGATSA